MKRSMWLAAALLAGMAASAAGQQLNRDAVMRSAPLAGAALQQRDYPARQTARETRTLALGPNGELNLETVSGEITLAAGSGRDVVVEIVRESRGRTDADAKVGLDRVQAEVDVRGTRATIRARYPNENHPPYSVSVAYRVTAPPETHVRAEVVSGNITSTGIHGELGLKTVSGNVRVTDAAHLGGISAISGDISIERSRLDGPVEARVTSGSIMATEVTAERVVLNTVSGDTTLRRVTASSMTANTISGNITFTGELAPKGHYQLQTHSGGIHLMLSAGTGFELEAQSFSGSIRSSLPLQSRGGDQTRGPRRTLRGTFGDGSAYIDATTFSGDIVIDRQ